MKTFNKNEFVLQEYVSHMKIVTSKIKKKRNNNIIDSCRIPSTIERFQTCVISFLLSYKRKKNVYFRNLLNKNKTH